MQDRSSNTKIIARAQSLLLVDGIHRNKEKVISSFYFLKSRWKPELYRRNISKNGYTVLHAAVSVWQLQVVCFLLGSMSIEVIELRDRNKRRDNESRGN